MSFRHVHIAAACRRSFVLPRSVGAFAQPTPGQAATASPLPGLFPSSARSLATTWSCSAASPTPSGAGRTPATPSASRSATTAQPATAGADHRWQVKIQPPAPGGPYTVSITGHQTVELHNVLVGDVWLCGGQSNMGLPLRFTSNADEEIKAANYPDIRFFTVGGHPAYHHVDVIEGNWSVVSPGDRKLGFGGRLLLRPQGPAGDSRAHRPGRRRRRRHARRVLDQRRRASSAPRLRCSARGTPPAESRKRARIRQLRHALVRRVRHRPEEQLGRSRSSTTRAGKPFRFPAASPNSACPIRRRSSGSAKRSLCPIRCPGQ